MSKPEVYRSELTRFLESCAPWTDDQPSRRLEWIFEGLSDWSLFGDVSAAHRWLLEQRSRPQMAVEQINLTDCEGWHRDPLTGNIVSDSGDFFVVEGVRVTSTGRERGSSWDQPIITQVGYDGGIIGLLSQRFSGVPHYLVEAKSEPGNPGIVQLSPTLQATFSNLRKAHGGRAPHFAKIFGEAEKGSRTLIDTWISEDGGRMFNKRNRGVIIEVPAGTVESPPDRFAWMSLFQIKRLVAMDALASPHTRSLLALM